VAEREGFEPPIPVKVWLISSQLHSTGLCHLSALLSHIECVTCEGLSAFQIIPKISRVSHCVSTLLHFLSAAFPGGVAFCHRSDVRLPHVSSVSTFVTCWNREGYKPSLFRNASLMAFDVRGVMIAKPSLLGCRPSSERSRLMKPLESTRESK
jgi:hypothetical protein